MNVETKDFIKETLIATFIVVVSFLALSKGIHYGYYKIVSAQKEDECIARYTSIGFERSQIVAEDGECWLVAKD